jgi:hypothetical protein
MPEPDVEQDEERVEAVHAAVREGKPVIDLVRPWGKEEAKRIIDIVLGEYVAELNGSLMSSKQPYGVNASRFMSHYNALWQAKLDLWRS